MTTSTEDLRDVIMDALRSSAPAQKVQLYPESTEGAVLNQMADSVLQAISQQPTEHSLEDELPTIPPKKVEEIRNLEWYLERLPKVIKRQGESYGAPFGMPDFTVLISGKWEASYRYEDEMNPPTFEYTCVAVTPLQAAQSLYKKLKKENIIND